MAKDEGGVHSSADVVVVGGGPAGLMAAIGAARGGHRTVVLERMAEPGRKLLATGGGQCNLTVEAAPKAVAEAFGSQARFVRPVLYEFGPAEIRAFFARLGVPTEVQPDGCVFPKSRRAVDVLYALVDALRQAGGEIRGGVHVRSILVDDGRAAVVETDKVRWRADRIVLAAGGRGYPGLGSDGSGFALAEAAGHTLVPPVPGLVPLVTEEAWVGELAGISLPAELRIDLPKHRKRVSRADLLFTHRGISGPVVLNRSADVAECLSNGPVPLSIAMTPGVSAEDWEKRFAEARKKDGGRAVRHLLRETVPQRLADKLLFLSKTKPDTPLAELPGSCRKGLIDCLTRLPLTVTATEGWSRAMVTRGGVSRREIRPDTLESRRVSGLYFAGEVIDVDGPCGGYNLTWAFASGARAGGASRA